MEPPIQPACLRRRAKVNSGAAPDALGRTASLSSWMTALYTSLGPSGREPHRKSE